MGCLHWLAILAARTAAQLCKPLGKRLAHPPAPPTPSCQCAAIVQGTQAPLTVQGRQRGQAAPAWRGAPAWAPAAPRSGRTSQSAAVGRETCGAHRAAVRARSNKKAAGQIPMRVHKAAAAAASASAAAAAAAAPTVAAAAPAPTPGQLNASPSNRTFSSMVPVFLSMCAISRWRRRRALCLSRRARHDRLSPSKSSSGWNLPHCGATRARELELNPWTNQSPPAAEACRTVRVEWGARGAHRATCASGLACGRRQQPFQAAAAGRGAVAAACISPAMCTLQGACPRPHLLAEAVRAAILLHHVRLQMELANLQQQRPRSRGLGHCSPMAGQPFKQSGAPDSTWPRQRMRPSSGMRLLVPRQLSAQPAHLVARVVVLAIAHCH